LPATPVPGGSGGQIVAGGMGSELSMLPPLSGGNPWSGLGGWPGLGGKVLSGLGG
jgi:hypothetical protein